MSKDKTTFKLGSEAIEIIIVPSGCNRGEGARRRILAGTAGVVGKPTNA
jgi:hypothetical protein